MRPGVLKAPPWPHVAQLERWLSLLISLILQATRYCDSLEIGWTLEVKKFTFEALAEAGTQRMQMLDKTLKGALRCILPPDLKKEVQDMENTSLRTLQTALSGRQILWLILDYFRVNGHMDTLYSVKKLMEIEWMGDKPPQIASFTANWKYLVDLLDPKQPVMEETQGSIGDADGEVDVAQ